jgi:hypothetical protein
VKGKLNLSMKKTFTIYFPILPLIFLLGCHSEPKRTGPDWVYEPTRIVDNGYIVYVGKGQFSYEDRAQFKAEGLALEDLANECSLIPKGTRIEDRYSEQLEKETVTYVKIGVEFQECIDAQKTVDPIAIKKIASVNFAEQLKKYQDLEETGEMPEKTEGYEVLPMADVPPAPAQNPNWSSSVHFYAVRQYVAYQKEVVILSPPTAYAPQSVETQHFVSAVQPATNQLQVMEQKDPSLKSQPKTWSQIQDRPKVQRPQNLVQKAPSKKWTTPYRPSREQKPMSVNKHSRKGGKRKGQRREEEKPKD